LRTPLSRIEWIVEQQYHPFARCSSIELSEAAIKNNQQENPVWINYKGFLKLMKKFRI